MKTLRERGLYLAPDGQTLVASRLRRVTADGSRILSRNSNELICFLFNRYQWAFHGIPDYEVGPAGKLLCLQQSFKLANYRLNRH
jgi:hypothetical protein